MIRNTLTDLLENSKLRHSVKALAFLISFLSWIAFFTFFLFGEDTFISEKAVLNYNLKPNWDSSLTEEHFRYLSETDISKDNTVLNYIESVFLKNNIQPHRQYFKSKFVSFKDNVNLKGVNLYGIYRTKRAESGECNLISFDHNLAHRNGEGKYEIAFALGLLEMFTKFHDNINYMSRDIIFLAYDGRFKHFGKAVNEFLDAYYSDDTLQFERCGTIRQAVNVEIASDNFNRLLLAFQGINGRLPDHDYYVGFQEELDSHAKGKWGVDEDMSVEKDIEKFLNKNFYDPLVKYARKHKYKLPAGKTTTLTWNCLKNYAFGRHHDAHSYYMERGIPAVTLRGHQYKNKDESPEVMIGKMGKVIETMNRASMGLQEQLHAGSRHYILLKNDEFIMVGRYCLMFLPIPISIMLRGLILFYEQKEKERNQRKAVVRYISLIATLVIINETHHIMQLLYSKFYNKELTFCLDSVDPEKYNGYSNLVTNIYLMFAFAIYVIGNKLFPTLIQKMLGDLTFPPYTFENWKTLFIVQAGHVGLWMIACIFFNAALGLFGTYFICPIFFFLRPIKESKKSIPCFLIIVAWLGALGWGLQYLKNLSGMDTIDILRNFLMPHWCYGADTVRFTLYFIIPSLIFIKQILFFRAE